MNHALNHVVVAALTALALGAVGCDNTSSMAEGRTITMRGMPTYDPAEVEALKQDIARLRSLLASCGTSDSVQCHSARKANYDLMFAPPAPATSAPRVFHGGSRDLKAN